MEADPHPILARVARDHADPHLDRPRADLTRVAAAVAIAITCACPAALAQPRTGAPAPAPASPDPPEEQEISPEEPATPPQPEPPPPPAPAPGPPRTAAPAAPEHVHTMDEVTVPQNLLRFGINFFGDLSAGARYPARPRTAFSIGTLGLRMLGKLGPSLDALTELAFETTADGPIADIEQVALRWRYGPGELVVGRFHTDLGYWSTAYHHGLWLQVPIARPRALRFEDDGGLFPAHWVGAQYTLGHRTSSGDLALVLAVGNGRGDVVDDVRVTDDTNDAKAGLAKVRWRGAGVEVGLGFLYDLIAPAAAAVRPALPGERIHELVGNAYVAVRGGGPVVIAEGYAFHHRAGGRSFTTLVGYGLLGFELTPALVPYAAVDVIRGADDDPFFAPDPAAPPALDVLELLGGIKLETSTWSALKLELRFTHQPRDPDGDDDYAATVNWSFGL
jgi:hypothetical protein